MEQPRLPLAIPDECLPGPQPEWVTVRREVRTDGIYVVVAAHNKGGHCEHFWKEELARIMRDGITRALTGIIMPDPKVNGS